MQARFLLVAVVQETTGLWGSEGLNFLQDIGQKIAEKTGEKRSTAFLLQRLSIGLQCGKLASIF